MYIYWYIFKTTQYMRKNLKGTWPEILSQPQYGVWVLSFVGSSLILRTFNSVYHGTRERYFIFVNILVFTMYTRFFSFYSQASNVGETHNLVPATISISFHKTTHLPAVNKHKDVCVKNGHSEALIRLERSFLLQETNLVCVSEHTTVIDTPFVCVFFSWETKKLHSIQLHGECFISNEDMRNSCTGLVSNR